MTFIGSWDAENDRFVRPLFCPHCEAPSPVVPDEEREACLCTFCGRPFELVLLEVGEGQGARAVFVARRPTLAHCSTTGQRLVQASALDWAGQNGSASRSGAVRDARGLLYGEPVRDVAWDLEKHWSQARMGKDDGVRPDEIVTSVSVWKGIVVVVTASGLVGLFNPDDGAPLLQHAISWPGVDLEASDSARAVRLPVALQGTIMVLGTDRTVLVRDLAPAIFPRSVATSTARLFTEIPAGAGQWIGPPLLCGDRFPRAFLVNGIVTAEGVSDGVVVVVNADGPQAGEIVGRVPAGSIARPPVYDDRNNVVVWVSSAGHIHVVDVAAPIDAPRVFVPQELLILAPQERALLLVAHDAKGDAELWLADDNNGLRVWRVSLGRVLSGAAWSWEPLLDAADIGALRALCVGASTRIGSVGKALAGQLFLLATERSTAAFTRALKSNASDSVLARSPIAPPVMTPAGYLSQDRQGLWLRALPPWSFVDDNPERFLDPGTKETRPAFYDRTFAVVGRDVFFAHGGQVHKARLVPRRAPTAVR
ncbi:MAG: hypothetical protein Q8O67_28215 [Deltaproteobacteria bacterium]|nr:hypothetical protein [Deltaproteobacteria bacterium]